MFRISGKNNGVTIEDNTGSTVFLNWSEVEDSISALKLSIKHHEISIS